MNLKLKRPLCFFDLETTGTNISQDRIVEIAVVKLMPSGERISKVDIINPTVPIPEDSARIHGIRDADVVDKPTFKEVAREYLTFFEGCDLAGFNILKFDIPVLVEEFLRAGRDFDYSRRRIVDVQRIYHLMEKRNLAAALQFYCHRELKDAHSAEADTIATLDVFLAQMQMYENKPVVDGLGQLIGTFPSDIENLQALVSPDLVDLAGRMIRNEKGQVVFNFGKHRLKPVEQVLREEPSYYDWMMNGDFTLDTKRVLTELRLATMKR